MKRRLFNFQDIGKKEEQSPGAPPADQQLGIKFLHKHYQKIDAVKSLAGRLPVPGEVMFLFTLNSFNAFTFIPYIIKQKGQIEQLIISTYSINQRILQSFIRLMDKNEILHVHILISDSIKFRVPKVADQLLHLQQVYQGRFTVAFQWNHSKIALIKTGSDHYVVEGSGNWSENARNEQYIFLNSEQVYRFREKCINS